MLEITNLSATVAGTQILDGLTLSLPAGQVHAIMGPNGAGKSTLSYVLAGKPGYEVTGGTATYNGQDLLALKPEERAAAGLFLAFQYPVEIPGVTNATFLKESVNAIRAARGQPPLDVLAFAKWMRAKVLDLGMSDEMLKRAVNVGFSGGEKKRNDMLQMAALEPSLAILDETDSGLDVDALRIVAQGVNRMRAPERAFLVITHYQRLLDYIVPDRVHVLAGGKIVDSGDASLAKRLEVEGYAKYGDAA